MFSFENRTQVYRALIVVSWLLYAIWYFMVDYQTFADPSIAKLLSLDGYAAIFHPKNAIFTIGIFWLWLLAAIGLFFYKNWGRYLYLGLSVWALAATALYGVRVASPLDSFLDLAVNLLDGAILAMVYLHPMKDMFESNARKLF